MKEKERQEYIAQRDMFLTEKGLLEQEIIKHNKIIINLEQQISEIRPRLVKEGMLCKKCDCISMEFRGKTNHGNLIYECVICGGDNSYR